MPPPQGTPNPIEGPGDYTTTSLVHNDTYSDISPLSNATHAGKSVFIAGASRGIGAAMAISFAQAGASYIAIGARSNLTSVREQVLAAAIEAQRPVPEVLCVKLDVSSQISTEEAAQLVEKTFSRYAFDALVLASFIGPTADKSTVDILVINAGILGTSATVAESKFDSWWEVWEVNLKGPYAVSRAFLPLILKGGDKTIITTSSVGAHAVMPGMSAYQTTKLAVLRLMEFISVEYGEQGIAAWSIHPGNIPTDMIGGLGGLENIPETLKAVFTESPELSADTIVYLTREKRRWLAGRYVNCTWDMPELMAQEEEIVKGDKLKVRLVL